MFSDIFNRGAEGDSFLSLSVLDLFHDTNKSLPALVLDSG